MLNTQQDIAIHHDIITQDENKNRHKNFIIEWGSYSSPFGHCFLALTKNGICKLAFYDTGFDVSKLQKEMSNEWPNAKIIHHEEKIKVMSEIIFDATAKTKYFKLFLTGTAFQIEVWRTLLSIPKGELRSYQDIAIRINKPSGVRAVASAIAKNNIAVLIPCHRVIRQNGDVGQYRYGACRKKALITWEGCSLKLVKEKTREGISDVNDEN